MEHDFQPDDAAPWPETKKDETTEAAATYEAAPEETTSGGREWLIGAVALLLAAGGTLALLVAREGSPSTVAAATPRSVATESAARSTDSTAWLASAPRWTPNPESWIGRQSGIAYEVSSAEPVGVWMRTVRPALVVRCVARRPEVFVFTDSAATIEANTEDHTVRFAVDDEEPTSMRWPDGAEHNALFAPDPQGLMVRLRHSQSFTFTFTPHNATPVTMHFNTQGLSALIDPAARHCGRP